MMLNSVKSRMANLTINDDIQVSLEKYIKDKREIPVSLFSSSNYADGIAKAIEYLIVRGEGVVEVPATDVCSTLLVDVHLNRSKIPKDSFTFSSHRPPIDGEYRPYTGEEFKVGDRITNTDLSSNKCQGWVCTKGGSPGIWKQYGALANFNNEIEIVSTLPEPNKHNLGRYLLYYDDEYEEMKLYCCVYKEGLFDWVDCLSSGSVSLVISDSEVYEEDEEWSEV